VPEEPASGPPPPICATCPVRAECEEYGRATGSSGWWGGVLLRLGFAPREWKNLRIWAKELVLTNETPGRDLRAEIANGEPTKMTQPIVDEMRERYAEGGRTRRQIAEDFGFPLNTVRGILSNQTWTGQRAIVRGEDHPRSRLTRDDVIEIRRRCAEGENQQLIARDYGVSTTAVCNIHTRRRWASIA